MKRQQANRVMDYWKDYIDFGKNETPRCFVTGEENFEVCHIVPAVLNGKNTVDNLILLNPLYHDLFFDTDIPFSVVEWVKMCRGIEQKYTQQTCKDIEDLEEVFEQTVPLLFTDKNYSKILSVYEKFIVYNLDRELCKKFPIMKFLDFFASYHSPDPKVYADLYKNVVNKRVGLHIANRRLPHFISFDMYIAHYFIFKSFFPSIDINTDIIVEEGTYEKVYEFYNVHKEKFEILKAGSYYYLRGDETAWKSHIIFQTYDLESVRGVKVLNDFIVSKEEYSQIFNFFSRNNIDLLERPFRFRKKILGVIF